MRWIYHTKNSAFYRHTLLLEGSRIPWRLGTVSPAWCPPQSDSRCRYCTPPHEKCPSSSSSSSSSWCPSWPWFAHLELPAGVHLVGAALPAAGPGAVLLALAVLAPHCAAEAPGEPVLDTRDGRVWTSEDYGETLHQLIIKYLELEARGNRRRLHWNSLVSVTWKDTCSCSCQELN